MTCGIFALFFGQLVLCTFLYNRSSPFQASLKLFCGDLDCLAAQLRPLEFLEFVNHADEGMNNP